jgi:mevalonate kinase
VATLFNSPLDPAQLYEYAMIGEKLVHGRPSGIDAFVSINGGLVKVRGNKREVVGCPPFWLMVSDSGESRNTGDMVRRVSEYRNMNRESFETLLRATEALVDDSVEALRRGDISILAQGMNFNQEALRLVGASTEKIDTMVRTARAVGFTGAKLTGAGGGGCIIAVQAPDPQKSFENFRANYPSSFLCSVPGEGVKTWLF